MLIFSTVSMISNNDRCFVCGRTGHLATTAPMHSATAAINLATLYRNAPTRFFPQNHHSTNTGLDQGHDTPTPKGTDHNSITIETDMGDISTKHNHTANPTVTGATAVTEGTHHTPHLSTTETCTTFW